MVKELTTDTKPDIIYPDSDGQPMAYNTKQFRWIVKIKENLEILFAETEDVFVAGDLLWYPVQGNNKKWVAPDVMVVFGRPKGERGSYKQWEEDDITPQVVFEILSPGNRPQEMMNKLLFYQHYGVEEYYVYDPNNIDFTGSVQVSNRLESIEEIENWVSPRLGIHFHLTAETLEIYRPDGEKFLTSVELDQLRQQEKQRADYQQQRADRLAALLRERGIDPNE